MARKREIRKLSSRYCPKLEDHVVVMTTNDPNGFPMHTCLSSHLCHGDDKARCEHDSAGKQTFMM